MYFRSGCVWTRFFWSIQMNIDKRRVYWIIISAVLTVFGTYELYQLFNTYIYDSTATKSSTLTLNADFLAESLGITVCHTFRPNVTFLKEHNISENLFNYGLSFYHTNEELKIVGDPRLLRLELSNLLNDNITAISLKRFFQAASINPSTPVTKISPQSRLLHVKDITYQGSAICNQYAFENKRYWRRWLELGYAFVSFRNIFVDGDRNKSNTYISIYNYDDMYHPETSENFVSLLFRRNVDYFSKINVQLTKYVRKFHCKPTPAQLIPPINRAKAICLETCAELVYVTNCSRINEIFDKNLKPAPACSWNQYRMEISIDTDGVVESKFRQCLIDRRCNQAHYCTEWVFNMNFLAKNGGEPEIINERNDTDDTFGSHDVSIQFLADSYLVEEVEMMTIDTLLANVAGLLGLLCGFELTMVAKFFLGDGSVLVTRFVNVCFGRKRPPVASGRFGMKCFDAEIGSNYVSRASRVKCEISVKEISEV